jgi:Fe2+ transport system protein FeoA
MAGVTDANNTDEGAGPAQLSSMDTMPIGVSALLDHVSDPDLAGRLMSMGIFPGAQLKIIRMTLARRTYFIRVEHHCIALRKREAASLMVRPAVA